MNHPWIISLGSAVIGDLVVFGATVGFSHSAADRHSVIADEVRTQLTGDWANQNARIAAEISKQLAPIHQQIEVLSQDIGKIKDHEHIADLKTPVFPGSVLPGGPSPLQKFAGMNQETFAASLPELYSDIRTVSLKQAKPNDETFRAIATKLRQTNQNSPEYWPTVLRFLELATARNSSQVPPSTAGIYVRSEGSRNLSLQGISDKRIVLNGGSLINSTFVRCRIQFVGTPTELQNVLVVDSVVEFQGIPENPPEPIKRIAETILASDFSRIKL